MISKIPIDLLPPKTIEEFGGINKFRSSIRLSILKEEEENVRVGRASAAQVVPMG